MKWVVKLDAWYIRPAPAPGGSRWGTRREALVMRDRAVAVAMIDEVRRQAPGARLVRLVPPLRVETRSVAPKGADHELTVDQRKNLDMHHTLALIHGFNEMAIKATTLGEKTYYRMARDAAEARFNGLGGKIDRIEDHAPLLVIPGHVPEVRFDERDIELMRECVARYDAEKTTQRRGTDLGEKS